MIGGRELLVAIIGGLLVAPAADADMVPVSELAAGCPQRVHVCSRPDLQHASSSSPCNCPGVADLDLWSVRFLPEANADLDRTPQIQHFRGLTEGPGSVSLCLYALIGVGLCNWPRWVRKVPLGFIPEWYHNGGPFQIGHRLAVSPESLRPAPACCFIQPVWVSERLIPRYRRRTLVSCWRKSQFTPDVIVSRGPPVS